MNLQKDLGFSQQAKITKTVADKMSDFYGKGTHFLCLLRNFSQRGGGMERRI